MTFSVPHQLDLPDAFPMEAYVRFYESARNKLAYPSDPRREFNAASNLIGWRFRGATEYSAAILSSWSQFVADVSFEVKYARERDLFGMFSCGVAALEATCYACHALLSVLTPPALPFDTASRRRSSSRWLSAELIRVLPSAPITMVLQERLGSDEWKVWTDFRNTMTHRADIPRIIYGAVGQTPPPARLLAFADRWSHGALAGDESEFRGLLRWLSGAMGDLMNAGSELAAT